MPVSIPAGRRHVTGTLPAAAWNGATLVDVTSRSRPDQTPPTTLLRGEWRLHDGVPYGYLAVSDEIERARQARRDLIRSGAWATVKGLAAAIAIPLILIFVIATVTGMLFSGK
jgi:hypothetical protein